MSADRVAIVQARMGSNRFPGKVLTALAGKPMLQHVLDRLERCEEIDQVIVATSNEPSDDALAKYVQSHGVSVYRGDQNDVLDRYYQAAKQNGAKTIVRVTADCPLLDPKVIDKAVTEFSKNKVDYATNTLHYTYPEGMDVEVFSFSALEKAWKEAKDVLEREHVTLFIRRDSQFRKHNVERDSKDVGHMPFNLSVDRPEDLKLIESILKQFPDEELTYYHENIIKLLQENPTLANAAKSLRFEGHYISILKDSKKSPMKKRGLKKSEQWFERANAVIPLASQTMSKASNQFVRGVAPLFLEKEKGARVWDVDGNEYIDYIMALCPVVLGHAEDAVDNAAAEQMSKGIAFSLPTPLEVELAEKLCELIPCAEMVRFAKNGSDVTSAAIRVARAFTNREMIACCGYHGWQDWYVGTTTRNAGVPESTRDLTKTFTYNDADSLEKLFTQYPGKIAAVILEPIGVEEPKNDFLKKVQELTQKHGALLIFDEVVTGFRVSLGGAQEYFGVTPDLACFGKAMANGYPLSALVGKRQYMKKMEEVFVSMTFGGEAVSLAASLETIRQIEKRKVIAQIWEMGAKLKDGINYFCKEFGIEKRVQCVGLAPRSLMQFQSDSEEETRLMKSAVQQELLKRGILFGGGHNISASHGDREIDETLYAYRDALKLLAEGLKKGNLPHLLEGEIVQPVFRKA